MEYEKQEHRSFDTARHFDWIIRIFYIYDVPNYSLKYVSDNKFTFERLVDLVPELVEPAPLGLAVRDDVVLHPAPAGELVEVSARVRAHVQRAQDIVRCKTNMFTCIYKEQFTIYQI